MVDLESIKERYGGYDWNEHYKWVRYLSIGLLIFGSILILAGLVVGGLMIAGRITLPYSSGIRIVITAAVLILGLLLGSGLIAMSRILVMVLDVERNTRYAMNIWFILEEKDLSDEDSMGSTAIQYTGGEEDSSNQ